MMCGYAVLPASTVRIVPVTAEASLESKNFIDFATSSVVENLCSGLRLRIDSSFSSSRPCVMSVSIYPGATQLTVTFAFPNSRANDFDNPIRLDFVAPYTERPEKPVEAIMDETLIILPQRFITSST